MNIGVIGCGAIATSAHLPAIRSLSNINLYAVADIREKMAIRTAKKYGAKKYFKNYLDMINDDIIDMVIICTPSNLHSKMIIDSARAGKHILVEKPMTLTVEEGISALNEVKKNNVKLCVVQNMRYLPSMKKVKRTIDLGELGNIVSIFGCANTQIPFHWTSSSWLYHEGGAIDDFGPHLLDALCWLIDSKPQKVVAFGGDFLEHMNSINYVQILIGYENGTVATANISWLTTIDTYIQIFGTGGSVLLDLRFDHMMQYQDFLDPIKEARSIYRKIINTTRNAYSGDLFKWTFIHYRQLINDFIRSIEKGAKIPTTGEEALRVTQISEAAKLSIRNNKVIYI